MKGVSLHKVIEHMTLKNLTPEINLKGKKVTSPEVNRLALQLTGYFEYFDADRVQIIGYVEFTYLEGQSVEHRRRVYEKLMSYDIPCVVYSSELMPDEEMFAAAKKANIPIFQSSKTTSAFMAEIIRWLNVELAPMISIHGVLVDVYGEGVLIMGESGIGKSEAALELVKRGHRLVTDDVVEIRRVSDQTLTGTAPDITRHFIELRGIGIVNVQSLFGFASVTETKTIDLVIKLEEWSRNKEYERLGLTDEYTEFLGNKVPCYSLPIRPGRNLAVICETVAVNYRQKKMGYDAAAEFYKRVQDNMARSRDEEEDE